MLRIVGYILLGLLALLLILLLLPVRARVRYDGALKVWAGCGPVNLRLLPKKEGKKAAPKKPKKEKKKPQEGDGKKPKKKRTLSLSEILDYVRVALDAVGKLRRRLRVPHLQANLVVGGKDAAAVALTYGRLAGAISSLYPVLDRNLRIGKTDISVDADFEKTKIEAIADVTLSACPLRMLFAVLLIGIAFLKVYLKNRKGKEQKGGKNNEQHQ